MINRNDGSNADWTQAAIVMGGTEGAVRRDQESRMKQIGGEFTKSSSCEKKKKIKDIKTVNKNIGHSLKQFVSIGEIKRSRDQIREQQHLCSLWWWRRIHVYKTSG